MVIEVLPRVISFDTSTALESLSIPRTILFPPVVISLPALRPIRTFPLPEVTATPALNPTAVFWLAVQTFKAL